SLTLLLSCIVPVAVHIARRRRIAELISKIPGPTAAHPILGNLDQNPDGNQLLRKVFFLQLVR
ncbi:hypothetical protein IscW_ISCW022707, partial [Ixodes scapularis]